MMLQQLHVRMPVYPLKDYRRIRSSGQLLQGPCFAPRAAADEATTAAT